MKRSVSPNIILALGVATTSALALYFYIKKKETGGSCVDGDTITVLCPDGSRITTHRCTNGAWQATGETCPITEINARINNIIVNPNNYFVGDTIIINTDLTNTGNVMHEFKIGVSIGKDATGTWYDVGYYNDGYGDYRGVILPSGSSVILDRSLTIPNDTSITDIWVTVKDQSLNILDDIKIHNIITVS